MKEITETNFSEIIHDNNMVVIDVWAQWCGPCKQLAPIIEKVSQDFTDVLIGKLNIEDNPEIATEYQIKSIPTIMFFKNGEHINSHVGMIQESKLVSKINDLKNG